MAIASNGPGVANGLPGVAVENGEGNRVLLIASSRQPGSPTPTGLPPTSYFDHVAAIRPIAKWSESAPSYERIPELLRRAMRKAYEGRHPRKKECSPIDADPYITRTLKPYLARAVARFFRCRAHGTATVGQDNASLPSAPRRPNARFA